MREQLEKLLAETEKEHAGNQSVYHKAMKEQAAAGVKLRKACDLASKSANNLAAIRKAVDALPKEEPEVEAS